MNDQVSFIIHPHDTVTVPNAEECVGKAKSCCYTAAVVLYWFYIVIVGEHNGNHKDKVFY